MSSVEKAQTLLTKVLIQRKAVTPVIVAPRRCAVRISFYDPIHIEFVAQEFSKVAGHFTRVNDSLVNVFNTHEEAMKAARELDSIIYAYNEAILAKPFVCGWLPEYLEMQSLGINVIMADQNVTSLECELNRQMAKKIDNDPKHYLSRRKHAKENILSYSYDMLKADVLKFLGANITAQGSHVVHVQSCIDAMFDSLSSVVKGKIALESYTNQRLVNAIEGKSNFMLERSNPEAEVTNYRIGVEKAKSAERFLLENTLSFEHVNSAIKGALVNLMDGVDLTSEHTRFDGLDLMYSSPYELSDMNKSRCESLAESRYCSVGEMMAYLLTDMFLEYFRMTSAAKHHAALMQLSDDLSSSNLYNDAIENIYRQDAF